jgi:carbonic anhydrase/acetyltransferase-like protein (isoleucine patch superfamily)
MPATDLGICPRQKGNSPYSTGVTLAFGRLCVKFGHLGRTSGTHKLYYPTGRLAMSIVDFSDRGNRECAGEDKPMRIYPFNGKLPKIGRNCMIADTVVLIGDIEIGDDCSIWPGVVIRSDTTPVRIGNNVHIEENSVLHTSTHIEDNVMIGHCCTIEAFVGHDSMIGNTASLMPLSRIGAYSAVAAGSVVLDQHVMPAYSFVTGSPAKVHSTIDPDNPKHAMRLARTYIDGSRGMAELAREYLRQGLWAVNTDTAAVS